MCTPPRSGIATKALARSFGAAGIQGDLPGEEAEEDVQPLPALDRHLPEGDADLEVPLCARGPHDLSRQRQCLALRPLKDQAEMHVGIAAWRYWRLGQDADPCGADLAGEPDDSRSAGDLKGRLEIASEARVERLGHGTREYQSRGRAQKEERAKLRARA